MGFLLYLSDFMIPFVILYIVGLGLLQKVSIFDAFTKGAKDGFGVVVGVLPTLIGLMIAIGMLRASGALDYLASGLSGITDFLHFPSELVPLSLIKLVSSSAATGLLLDIYKQFGTDSYLGNLASILMSCSETIFYTLAVYFMATKIAGKKPVKKIRWTLWGSLLATLAGMIASVMIVGMM